MENKDNLLIQELEQYRDIMPPGRQRKYYDIVLEMVEPIEVVSLSEVFTVEEIEEIKRQINPKKKECFKNAMRLAMDFDDVKYVEGRLLLADAFGTEHAFNKVGDKYIDITMELALGNDVRKEQYIKIAEYSRERAIEELIHNQCYTNITDRIIWEERIKKENKDGL